MPAIQTTGSTRLRGRFVNGNGHSAASLGGAEEEDQQMAFAIAGLLVVGLVSVVLARLKPAAPTVERATVWVDTVKRGAMLRQVRGLGTLVPVDEARRWVPAGDPGPRRAHRPSPGRHGDARDRLLELDDPQAQPAARRSRAAVAGAEADLASLDARAPDRAAQPARRSRPRSKPITSRRGSRGSQRGPRQGRPRLQPDPQAIHGQGGFAGDA